MIRRIGTTSRNMAAASALFLGAFALYLWCFQPAGSWGDGADFVLCSWFLGVPHPTGYPAFVLLGKAASLVPLGGAGMRVGLLSSFAGALCVALMFTAAARVARSAAAGAYAAAVLALSSFFWSQSAIVEAYSLNLAFCLALLPLLLSRDNARFALAFFPIAALGLGNHGTLVVPAVLFGLVLLIRASRLSGVVPAFAAVGFLVLMGLSSYLCLPMFSARSQLFDWNSPQFARNLPVLLSGLDFWVIGEYIPPEMWRNFTRLSGEVLAQAGPLAILLFILGACASWKNVRGLAAIIGSIIIAGAFPILYPTREKESFFLVSYALMLLLAAGGAGLLLSGAGNKQMRLASGALVVFLACLHSAALLRANRHTFEQRRNITPEIYSNAVFESARRDSLVLIDHLADDTIFPPLYSQFIDGRRPDVFLFHRLYLAFPWYLDSMRARAGELAPAARIPKIDVEAEREKNIEVSVEEKQRIEQRKTMNTVAIDIQTARLLDADKRVVPVYINTPQRFKRSVLSRGYEFAPQGALFRLGGAEGAPLQEVFADAARERLDPVFNAVAKETVVQRAAYHAEMSAIYEKKDKAAHAAMLWAVEREVMQALRFGEDCDLRDVLASVYARLGRIGEAETHAELAAKCRLAGSAK